MRLIPALPSRGAPANPVLGRKRRETHKKKKPFPFVGNSPLFFFFSPESSSSRILPPGLADKQSPPPHSANFRDMDTYPPLPNISSSRTYFPTHASAVRHTQPGETISWWWPQVNEKKSHICVFNKNNNVGCLSHKAPLWISIHHKGWRGGTARSASLPASKDSTRSPTPRCSLGFRDARGKLKTPLFSLSVGYSHSNLFVKRRSRLLKLCVVQQRASASECFRIVEKSKKKKKKKEVIFDRWS